MNRIYKVIWSKVKHQYVVVSELAHSCTKGASSRIGKNTATVLAALVLTAGIGGMSVQAANWMQGTGFGLVDQDGNSKYDKFHISSDGTMKTSGIYSDYSVNSGNSQVDGSQTIGDGQTVVGGPKVTDGQTVTGGQTVYDGSTIYGDSTIKGNQTVEQNQQVNGDSTIKGNQTVAQNQQVNGHQVVMNGQDVYGEAKFHNGLSAEGNKITNVSDGRIAADSLDAVNGRQLNAAWNQINKNTVGIADLNHRVDNLDSRIDKVGAGAAALAALHPLDFDPDAKWDFAAGYGNYGGENAVAVGTFYRPNEDTMFSVGGTFGNGENMINAGVSLKIGAGSSHVTTSRVAMAKEIKSMRDIVAKQDAQIQKLTAMVNALVGVQTETDTTTMFPDVPENHWAYEAVAAMAKSGLVKGYPDGEFKGDRNMTRYEFAQIVYNAIQAGAEVDARLVEEFKPELEYFHIATVAKDKDGNPTIERVRAN